MKKITKRIFTILGITLGTVVAVVVGYVGYVLIQYNRIEDNKVLEINKKSNLDIDAEQTFTISTYNIGFGAYRPNYSFFMDEGYMADGTKVVGKYGKAESKESVIDATEGAIEEIQNQNVDFAFYQEVDTNSTRSHHVNQNEMICDAFSSFDNVHAINYNSAYLFYPFSDPIGKSNSGLTTLSKYKIREAMRKSYPISEGFDKFFDLDRCFSVSRISIRDSQDLVLVNSHMSAYDEGGKIRAKQIEVMKTFFDEEVNKGNYVIFGGDFNHDLLKNNPSFNYQEGEEPSWMHFTQLKPDWLASIDYETDLTKNMQVAVSDNAPTCRDADLPLIGYETDLYKSVIDGFIVSNNIKIVEVSNIDNGFEYSDHQPVILKFSLN
ncbi:MAG: endonuclease [Erysipelotrichales bacterium]|nr:endonuclease [Erysipelotrichales bacterium]